MRLYDEWTKVDIVFTSSIDYPTGISDASSALCEYYFTNTADLGSGYSCSISGATLTVTLGEEAAFLSSSSLSTVANRLKVSPCTCGYNTGISVRTVDPFALSATVQTIVSPHLACAELPVTLENFAGLGGRSSTLRVAYSIISAGSTNAVYPRSEAFARSTSLINSFLSSQSKTAVTIPANLMLDSGQYTLLYKMTNFGATSAATVTFTTADYAVSPSISLLPSTTLKTIHEWESLTIVPQFTYSGCSAGNVAVAYNYTWGQIAGEGVDVFDNTVLQTFYSDDDGILDLASYTFLPERVYAFSVTATHLYYASISLTTKIAVRIVRSSVASSLSPPVVDCKDIWREPHRVRLRQLPHGRDSLCRQY